jgi:DNA-binding MarR family transcriptional regulator
MSLTQPEPMGSSAPSAEEIESVMLAARVLIGVTAQSVAAFAAEITLPQLRILAMVANRKSLNLDTMARGLGVHPSNATRACDKLVRAGLLNRRHDPVDRRHLVLELSEGGRDLVDRMTSFRRAEIERFLVRMPAKHRRALTPALLSFAAAGGEVLDGEAWALGWLIEVPEIGELEQARRGAARDLK